MHDVSSGFGRCAVLNDKIMVTNEKEFFYLNNQMKREKVDLMYKGEKLENMISSNNTVLYSFCNNAIVLACTQKYQIYRI